MSSLIISALIKDSDLRSEWVFDTLVLYQIEILESEFVKCWCSMRFDGKCHRQRYWFYNAIVTILLAHNIAIMAL
jgi:hypothetical protein